MRLAAIDLGSNTVRLLVVETEPGRGWQVVDQAQQVTRLGEGFAGTGRLGSEPMARTAAVVAAYVARAEEHGCREIRIAATSAVRESPNGGDFAARVEALTGRTVTVISGDDEARLTVRGVLLGLGPGVGRMCSFDIGGGSTEYVLADNQRVIAAVSLRLGVVPLAERHPFPHPVERGRWATLCREVRETVERGLPAAIRRAVIQRLVGTAGTVTTLAALDLGLATYEASRVQGHRLSRTAIERLAHHLGALDVGARAEVPCLEPGRADLILPGIAIVLATLDLLRQDALTVSDWGLREGLLADRLAAAP